jgi:hypothetical protein
MLIMDNRDLLLVSEGAMKIECTPRYTHSVNNCSLKGGYVEELKACSVTRVHGSQREAILT